MKASKMFFKPWNFLYGYETYSIVSCSTRDTSQRNLCTYNDFGQKKTTKWFADDIKE